MVNVKNKLSGNDSLQKQATKNQLYINNINRLSGNTRWSSIVVMDKELVGNNKENRGEKGNVTHQCLPEIPSLKIGSEPEVPFSGVPQKAISYHLTS